MIKKIAAAALLAGSVVSTAQTTAEAAGIPEALHTTTQTTTELLFHLPSIQGLRPPPGFSYQQGNGA
ncbi:hypothetical protein [Streptomyces sp. NPDC007100]|uniref:hypothetical protein n=1 Tax=unclassified Streptomyces TaxID=2593676 RepID=UPI0033F8BBC7